MLVLSPLGAQAGACVMVQGAFVVACGPKALELGPGGRLRKSVKDVEALAKASFGEAGQVLKSAGGCLVSAGQPSVISAAKTSSLLAVVVGCALVAVELHGGAEALLVSRLRYMSGAGL